MFEYRGFSDGDRLYKVPEWKKWVEEAEYDVDGLMKMQEKKSRIKKNEIGMKHPKTGASILLRDDGSIEILSGQGTGIVLEKGRLTMVGEEMLLSAESIQYQSGTNQIYMNNVPAGENSGMRKGWSPGILEEMRQAGLRGRGLEDED